MRCTCRPPNVHFWHSQHPWRCQRVALPMRRSLTSRYRDPGRILPRTLRARFQVLAAISLERLSILCSRAGRFPVHTQRAWSPVRALEAFCPETSSATALLWLERSTVLLSHSISTPRTWQTPGRCPEVQSRELLLLSSCPVHRESHSVVCLLLCVASPSRKPKQRRVVEKQPCTPEDSS